MKVAPAVEAELSVVDAAGTDVTAPRSEGIERGPAAAGEVQPGAGGARGSVEYLGIYLETDPTAPFFKRNERAMPVKMKGQGETVRIPTRIAFGRLVDELIKNKVPSGILGIAQWTEWLVERHQNQEISPPKPITVWRVYWSASPGDTSYQRHGSVGMVSRIPENIVHFADFEPVIEALGEKNQIAVYRVTLPREGLDPDKWAGRPPPPAPADLYTGPRSDDLLSTEEISGEYFSSCFPFFCSSVTVTPMGADVIEVKKRGWSMFLFCYPCMPICANDILTREPGTNAFDTRQKEMTLRQTESGLKWVQGEKEDSRTEFKDDGSMENDDEICCFGFCYRRRSKGRPFRKVETKDIAGTWCHYRTCLMPVPVWLCVAYTGALSTISCSTKTRLNEDQYKEGGCLCCSLLPLPLCPFSETRTRHYEKGHPTNWFDHHMGEGTDVLGHIYRDSGCVHGAIMGSVFPTMCLDCGWKCC